MQSDCKEGTHCIGGGYGGGSVGDGAPDQRDPHALGIYLLRVTPTDINPAEPFQVEFKILNTETAPIELPVSPHLSDFQPNDESAAFNYFSLGLIVRGEGETQRPDVFCMGFVELYGSTDHPESMMVLQPGFASAQTCCYARGRRSRNRRDSAEIFGCERIPSIHIRAVSSLKHRTCTQTPRGLRTWQSV